MEDKGQVENMLAQMPEDMVDELHRLLLDTQEQGQMMEHLIKNQIEVKDLLIDKLHKELEYYKQESADRFVEQLMKAVIKVRKDMKKLMSSEKWEQLSVEDLRREYLYVYEDMTDLLEQQLIDEYVSKQGDEFNATIHQAKIEATNDASKDKTIKQSLSEGYKKGDKIIIPERVIAYLYKE
ncbi:MAG: nucleotide exchange factor GrpE [Lachnospiraceae bacterium]|nr:nucleotide exchange factor GrpE [Lachnospiraceae bacterium]